MGIETVAVYADSDADAPFVAEADLAVALGGQTSAESYLDTQKVLDAARRSGADAVHPGYGFLAENAAFADQVEAAGLVWVGPSAHSISSMGDKLAAKALMRQARVPTLPSIELTPDVDLVTAASDIGYPVLIKAAAGGGGKGMRVVEQPADLDAAVRGAKREAASSFGDDTVFIEKYLATSRHIEIQVLGDQHGELVHLFERECSIQRRHQKIIEEAPSPALTRSVRNAMGSAAVAAAQTIGYYSAGTVEFLLAGDGDDAEFWFLEVNTRIQVEHPVTEEVTGIDLVREQIRVARGERLGYSQADLMLTGHAIEARLYAEDPANDFLPAIGTLHAFEAPREPAARIDSGVESGSLVGVNFDPMLAKVIVHASTRSEAAARLAMVLDRMVIAGVTTNRDFLVATLREPAFVDGDTTTDFIERVDPPRTRTLDDNALAAAARAAVLFQQQVNRGIAGSLAFMPAGFRNSSMPASRTTFEHGDQELVIEYRAERGGAQLMSVNEGAAVRCRVLEVASEPPWSIAIETDGVRSVSHISTDGSTWFVHGVDGSVELVELSRFPDTNAEDVAGGQTAPMPGKVLSIHVAVGDAVVRGQTLVVMEAMKMEHTLTAPGDGVISELRCSEGDQVDNGQVLVVLDAAAEATDNDAS